MTLAASILKSVNDVPVMFVRSGSARAIEAFLLANAFLNVLLVASFSVLYFVDSTINKDLAFTYKRIGAERVVFGSYFPYVGFEDVLSKTRLFFERNGFSDSEINTVFLNRPQEGFGRL